jgi:hypothetical protein
MPFFDSLLLIAHDHSQGLISLKVVGYRITKCVGNYVRGHKRGYFGMLVLVAHMYCKVE